MIFKIVILVVVISVGCYGKKLKYHHVGCYGDGDANSDYGRTLPEYLGNVANKDQCAALARHKGYKTFGVQNGKECWSGPEAYAKYGPKFNCKNGKGGPMANDVYIIGDNKKPECPEKPVEPEKPKIDGLTPKTAAKNCKTIKAINPSASTGVYWLNPQGGKAFKAYCDMDTAGGGWTLVYSYTFTNYYNFRSGRNAITPRPDWPAEGNVPLSTTPPLSETQYAAMHFNLWRQIGSEFMIKSNINHWIKCTEGTGGLLKWRTGTLSCQVVRNIGSVCHNIAPDHIKFITAGSGGRNLGPDLESLRSSSGGIKAYYYLETGLYTGNWPTHDPCSRNGLNHVKNVHNPHGNIYVR